MHYLWLVYPCSIVNVHFRTFCIPQYSQSYMLMHLLTSWNSKVINNNYIQYRIKCTSIQKGWYNNMKRSVKKEQIRKHCSPLKLYRHVLYLSELLICSPVLNFLLIMPYSYLHICIYLRMVCALVCVCGGVEGREDVCVWYTLVG